MSKKFIDITPMQNDLLKLLEEKFLNSTHFNSDNINISISLKDTVEKVCKEKQLEEPTIYILDTAWIKIQMLIKENSGEVAWHCLVERHPNNKYVIYDVLVFPQEVTSATADGSDGEYEMWVATLPDEQFDHLRCHMHSHVNMGVTPSSVDENYYANLMTHVQDYYITMIINKSHNTCLRFYDKENNILWSDLDFKICMQDGTIYDDWYTSVKDNIKEKKYTYQYNRPSTPATSLYSGNSFNSTKKKETASTQTKMNTTKTGTKGTKEFIISSPVGECLIFKDVNEATNYIYQYYEADITNFIEFNRNKIRTRLAKEDYVCINTLTLEFIDGIYEHDLQMQYAIECGEIWEVN